MVKWNWSSMGLLQPLQTFSLASGEIETTTKNIDEREGALQSVVCTLVGVCAFALRCILNVIRIRCMKSDWYATAVVGELDQRE